jgi:hypothetical protein
VEHAGRQIGEVSISSDILLERWLQLWPRKLAMHIGSLLPSDEETEELDLHVSGIESAAQRAPRAALIEAELRLGLWGCTTDGAECRRERSADRSCAVRQLRRAPAMRSLREFVPD